MARRVSIWASGVAMYALAAGCTGVLLAEQQPLCPEQQVLASVAERCEQDDWTACIKAADLHASCGTTGGYREAAALYERACSNGAADGCRHLGGLRSSAGTGAEDPAEARAAFQRAAAILGSGCDHGEAADCAALAEMVEAGQAGSEPLGAIGLRDIAISLYARRCSSGEALACKGLADLHSQTEKPVDAAAREKACELGDGPSCCTLGLTKQTASPGQPAAMLQVASYLNRACELGDGGCCSMAAELYEAGNDGMRQHQRAAQLYGRGCELGRPWACYRLGVLYRDGRGVVRDLGKASVLFKDSCARGVREACAR